MGRTSIRRPPVAVPVRCCVGHFETDGSNDGVEHTGHHDRDDRVRPGRPRCSAGVATNSWPTEHTQTR